jgi:peptide/nickel transport system permease protein
MRFALRRLGFFVLTLWVALTLNFLLPRMMPGNPAVAMMGKFKGGVTGEALKALEAQFGVNTHQSLPGQYVTYLGDVATGKFGTSTSLYPASVGRTVLDAIPWTLGLVGLTTILAFVLGTGIGILSAWRRGGRLDSIMPPVFVITSVIPYSDRADADPGLRRQLRWCRTFSYDYTLTRVHAGLHRERAPARHPARCHAADYHDRHLDPDHA